MPKKTQFLSRVSSCRYIFKNGKEAAFINHKYLTDTLSEIEELQNEINQGHPTIYVDKNNLIVDTATLDPLHEIRKKAVEDYLAEQAAASDITNDRGTSDNGKLNVASSIDGATLTAPTAGAAALAALTVKVPSVATVVSKK